MENIVIDENMPIESGEKMTNTVVRSGAGYSCADCWIYCFSKTTKRIC